MSESGVKYDQGKPRVGLMISDFSRALNQVATVSTFGANKYSASGWRTVENARERYWDALHRHLLAMSTSQEDEESGCKHLAHAAWNALALLELEYGENRTEAIEEPKVNRDECTTCGGWIPINAKRCPHCEQWQ